MNKDSRRTVKNVHEDLENTEREVTKQSQRRQPGRSGRPRLDAGAAVLPSERREQVRQAQKTYRLKKEAILESYKSRTLDLELRMKKLAELLAECHDSALQSNLHITQPELFSNLQEMKDHLAPEIEKLDRTEPFTHETTTNSDPDEVVPGGSCSSSGGHNIQPATRFGYQVLSPDQYHVHDFDWSLALPDTQTQTNPVENMFSTGPASEGNFEESLFLDSQYVDRPIGGSVPTTYSFHETAFSRRLHRYSLEHAYRMFVDSRSNPTDTYRVFRLVACIRDKAKMLPYFERLIRGGVEDALEIPTLPFYCIGGAGSHYPHKDRSGNLNYPSNMKLPRRILGIFPGDVNSHGTGSLDIESHLKLFGFDGDWFDCQDVQGYLEENGVVLHQSSSFANIIMSVSYPSTSFGEDTPLEQGQMNIQHSRTINNVFDLYDNEGVAGENTQLETNTIPPLPSISPYVFDMECFLSMLLRGLVVLGRAPGFRRSDVVTAFTSALRVQTLQ